MGSRKLVRVPGITTEWCSLLQQSDVLTCRDVLMLNIVELMNMVQSHSAALRTFKIVATSVAPSPRTALLLHQQHDHPHFLTTGVAAFDEVLHGGLHVGSITEIAGAPGCGKTQFSMTLSAATVINCVTDHNNNNDGKGCIVYIDTENAFSASRLQEIIQHRLKSAGDEKSDMTESISNATNRVIVYHEPTFESLDQRLKALEEVIIRKKVKLIVLDSIASLARKEMGHRGLLNERNKIVVRQATMLKYYAQTFNLSVLVTNQIKAIQEADVAVKVTDGDDLVPALGNTWAHAVNTRMVVKFCGENDNNNECGDVRIMCVEKSPIAPALTARYTIRADGVVGVD